MTCLLIRCRPAPIWTSFAVAPRNCAMPPGPVTRSRCAGSPLMRPRPRPRRPRADIEARDASWDSTPLEWAIVGSGMHLGHAADHDWVAAVRTLIEAGAATEGIVLSSDDPKPPSPEVAGLLRSYGIPDQASRPSG
jgi:hypothetical protein